jgi:hypothetical protein
LKPKENAVNTATLTTTDATLAETDIVWTYNGIPLTDDELDETNATAADDDVYCGCGAILTDAEIDESGHECHRCHMAHHFVCCDCGDTCDNEEASPKRKDRCETCQDTKDEEELEAKKDALKDEARELLEALCECGDLSDLRKAVARLKRLV